MARDEAASACSDMTNDSILESTIPTVIYTAYRMGGKPNMIMAKSNLNQKIVYQVIKYMRGPRLAFHKGALGESTLLHENASAILQGITFLFRTVKLC